MSIGAKLRVLRVQKGESLQEVADAVQASKAHIWELETGKSANPSLSLLTKLAKHFKVTIANLVGEASDELQSDEQYVVMHRDLQELGPDGRALIEDMIKSLKKRKNQESDVGN